MPSRRSHTKSHHGCRQCKARRVKCDETAPQCQRCVKRQIQCSFVEDGTEGFLTPSSNVTDHLTPNFSDHQTPEMPSSQRFDGLPPIQSNIHQQPSTPLPPPPPSSVNAPSPSLQSAKKFDLLELELVHHYSTRTYITLSSRLSTHAIFRDAVFREALRHEFLLHAIMATSALHKAATQHQSTEAYEEYAKVALTHQNAALAGYIPAVTNPNQHNSAAIFSLSLLLTIWAFASKTLPEGLRSAGAGFVLGNSPTNSILPANSPTAQFVDIILILRGILPVIRGTESWLQGDILEMLRYPRDEDLPSHPADVEAVFDILAESVRRYQPPDDFDKQHVAEMRDLCIDQVDRLRKISRCRSVVEWDGHIFSWLIMAPPEFISCLKRGDALALASFVHWAAVFRCMDHHWWANGWAQALVADVSNVLDRRVWATVLEWPRRQVGLMYQDGSSYEARRGP